MSTSDQQKHVADQSSGSGQRVADQSSGRGQLTRKQLREARLTGSTPIVTPEDAEAARLVAETARTPAATPPAPEPEVEEPLTRRQKREQERIRTGSTAVIDELSPAVDVPRIPERPELPTPAPAAPVEPQPLASVPAAPAPSPAAEMITDVPRAAPPTRRRSSAPGTDLDEQDGVDDAEQAPAPVPASTMRTHEEARRAWHADPVAPAQPTTPAVPAVGQPTTPAAPAAPASAVWAPAVPAAAQTLAAPRVDAPAAQPAGARPAEEESALGALFRQAETDEGPSRAEDGSEPTVNAGFGRRVLAEQPAAPQADSFDALIGDSTGSHHAAPNTLIFQQAPAALSLSGPVASTGEILVTGSYDLPAGLGSRGHADGVADGKEVDAVLVDGELAPASSPTPIAASAAIGTIKPAGEVIRPPEPEKGNKLMLALTITAGALAVALVGALIVAITTGAFSS